MARARTPGGHRLIRQLWTAAFILLVLAAGSLMIGRAGRGTLIVLGAALAFFVVGYVAYLFRHLGFEREVRLAEAALAAADLERARAILAPLLDRYPHLPLVQRAAGRTLYAVGDPLSAASLLEKAARSFRDDAVVATTLVASYAALNRGGDARRASALAPRNVDVRLALAWSELVALGGDRAAGAAIVRELCERADVRDATPRAAMAAVLAAVAAAHQGDSTSADAALREVARAREASTPFERAFIGYLEGVALRELGRDDDAMSAFTGAMDAAPGTIGEALARREHANLRARLAAHSSSPSAQPSSD